MVVELGHGHTALVGGQVRVAQRHLHRAVTEEIPHGVQRDPVLDEIGSKVMAQIVPAKVTDPGTLDLLSPALLKSCPHIKDAGTGAGAGASAEVR